MSKVHQKFQSVIQENALEKECIYENVSTTGNSTNNNTSIPKRILSIAKYVSHGVYFFNNYGIRVIGLGENVTNGLHSDIDEVHFVINEEGNNTTNKRRKCTDVLNFSPKD